MAAAGPLSVCKTLDRILPTSASRGLHQAAANLTLKAGGKQSDWG